MNRYVKPLPPLQVPLLVAIGAAAVLAHLLTITNYGFFRDEFYLVACSQRLALGYVDHPPLSPAVLAVVRRLFGDSLPAIRIAPVLAAGLVTFLAGVLAREFGGNRLGQGLSALCVAFCPLYLALFHTYSLNFLDILFWTLALLVVTRIMRTGQTRLWLLFGIIAGLGLLNKISILFLGFGLVVGLLLTRERKQFSSGWFWTGGLVAALLFLPHVIWQAQHGWPTLEFMENAKAFKMLALSPVDFLLAQALGLNLLAAPVWLAGLYYFFFNWRAGEYRLFGWMYLAILALMILQGAKSYYLAPVYPVLFAAGGLQLERLFQRLSWKGLAPVYFGVLVVSAVAAAPMAMPVLPPETYIRYSKALGLQPAQEERHEMGPLPQFFADMFGWPEMVANVAKVYDSLPAEDRSKCAIFGQNYGEAGAVDLLGSRYGLPDAISGHNNYWLWGPRGYTGEVVIVIGGKGDRLRELYRNATAAGRVSHPYSMPYENDLTIWVARGRKETLQSTWARTKHYD